MLHGEIEGGGGDGWSPPGAAVNVAVVVRACYEKDGWAYMIQYLLVTDEEG